jgi:uncharacterized RDD family membrane protein YckC
MGSALLDTTHGPALSEAAGDSSARAWPPDAASTEALRRQVGERLAAHRNRSRHGRAETEPVASAGPSRSANTRSARIVAAVAERYAHSQSYRAFLAAEAERAIQQARAAAEIAALNAQAVAAAQQKLLDAFDRNAMENDERHQAEIRADASEESEQSLTLWPELEPERRAKAAKSGHRESSASTKTAKHGTRATSSAQFADAAAPPSAGFTVRLYEDEASAAHVELGALLSLSFAGGASGYEERNEAEAQALDEEIAFRQAPVFEESAGPPTPLPANLIEFPRQLVASRKARPRLAEGPLREEAEDAPGNGQLRIFEVEPDQISTSPVPADTAAPKWTSIWLDAPSGAGGQVASAQASATAQPSSRTAAFPGAASIGRRILAAAINGFIVVAALLACAAAFAAISTHSMLWQPGVPLRAVVGRIAGWFVSQSGFSPNMIPAMAAVAGGFLYLLYQGLFFSFASATPGMRIARIALCTFDDENPTRRAMRRRIVAILLSACPLGLGFLWAALDEDRLAWHDRLSRMYQRSY